MPELRFPRAFVLADAQSIGAQHLSVQLLRGDLISLAVAAGLGALGSVLSRPASTVVYLASVVSLAVALIMEIIAERREPQNDWYDGRAVAESIKTSAWRYMMHAAPYDGEDVQAAAEFTSRVRESVAARPDLAAGAHTAADDLVTPSMRAIRALTQGERRDLYLRQRARDQERWYAGKARNNRAQAALWFRLGFAARVAALILAVLTLIHPFGSGFVEFFASLAAALTAWNQSRRHQELARSYGLAAQELAALVQQAPTITSEETLSEWVVNTENAVSREHTMWMAKRLQDPVPLVAVLATPDHRGVDA